MWAAWSEQENFLEQKVFGREEWELDVWWSGTEEMMWIIFGWVLSLGIRKNKSGTEAKGRVGGDVGLSGEDGCGREAGGVS